MQAVLRTQAKLFVYVAGQFMVIELVTEQKPLLQINEQDRSRAVIATTEFVKPASTEEIVVIATVLETSLSVCDEVEDDYVVAAQRYKESLISSKP